MKSYLVKVQLKSSGNKWRPSGLRFPSMFEAMRYGRDQALLHPEIQAWKVARSQDAPNARPLESGAVQNISKRDTELYSQAAPEQE
jgi:hypothetical protein